MKRVIYSLLLVMVIGCEKDPRDSFKDTGNIEENVPAVLNEDDWDISSVITSKRYENDIIEIIYKDLKKNDEEIKKLHSKIDDILSEKGEAVDSFHNYNNKITSYYNSANIILSQINNEELSELLNSVISKSETNYNEEIDRIRNEIENLSIEENDLYDYINTLKVVKTIAFIEAYEKKEKSDLQLLIRIKSDINASKNNIFEMIQQ